MGLHDENLLVPENLFRMGIHMAIRWQPRSTSSKPSDSSNLYDITEEVVLKQKVDFFIANDIEREKWHYWEDFGGVASEAIQAIHKRPKRKVKFGITFTEGVDKVRISNIMWRLRTNIEGRGEVWMKWACSLYFDP